MSLFEDAVASLTTLSAEATPEKAATKPNVTATPAILLREIRMKPPHLSDPEGPAIELCASVSPLAPRGPGDQLAAPRIITPPPGFLPAEADGTDVRYA